jgi:hypothetical protein
MRDLAEFLSVFPILLRHRLVQQAGFHPHPLSWAAKKGQVRVAKAASESCLWPRESLLAAYSSKMRSPKRLPARLSISEAGPASCLSWASSFVAAFFCFSGVFLRLKPP